MPRSTPRSLHVVPAEHAAAPATAVVTAPEQIVLDPTAHALARRYAGALKSLQDALQQAYALLQEHLTHQLSASTGVDLVREPYQLDAERGLLMRAAAPEPTSEAAPPPA